MIETILAFIVTVPPSVRLGDQVAIGFHLRNYSSRSVYVNSRFAVARSMGELVIKVSLNGKSGPFKYLVKLIPIKASDFILLKPNEQVSAGYLLTHGFDVSEPGEYRIEITYMNTTIPDELRSAGEPVATGQLAALPVSIQVRKGE